MPRLRQQSDTGTYAGGRKGRGGQRDEAASSECAAVHKHGHIEHSRVHVCLHARDEPKSVGCLHAACAHVPAAVRVLRAATCSPISATLALKVRITVTAFLLLLLLLLPLLSLFQHDLIWLIHGDLCRLQDMSDAVNFMVRCTLLRLSSTCSGL